MYYKYEKYFVIKCTYEQYDEILKIIGPKAFVCDDETVSRIVKLFCKKLTASAVTVLIKLLTDPKYDLRDWQYINVRELADSIGISRSTGHAAMIDLATFKVIIRDRDCRRTNLKQYKYTDTVLNILNGKVDDEN